MDKYNCNHPLRHVLIPATQYQNCPNFSILPSATWIVGMIKIELCRNDSYRRCQLNIKIIIRKRQLIMEASLEANSAVVVKAPFFKKDHKEAPVFVEKESNLQNM